MAGNTRFQQDMYTQRKLNIYMAPLRVQTYYTIASHTKQNIHS